MHYCTQELRNKRSTPQTDRNTILDAGLSCRMNNMGLIEKQLI